MNTIVKTSLTTLIMFVICLSFSSIAYGQTAGQPKIVYRLDENNRLIADTIKAPQRITWLGEKGVFLNAEQEYITLEKLQWKELYRQDAVSMYWVNLALEERIKQVLEYNKYLEDKLTESETLSARATANMKHYQGLYEETKNANIILTEKNTALKTQLIVFKGVAIVGGIVVVYSVINNQIK